MRTLLPLLTLTLLSCGYSTRSLLPPHLNTVGIEPIENLSAQPEAASLLEQQLRSEFARDRTLRVVDVERGDILLKIQVTGYSKEAEAYTGDQRISSYRLTTAASVSALDRVRDENLYSGTITAQISYDPNQSSEEKATGDLMARLARDIVRILLLAW